MPIQPDHRYYMKLKALYYLYEKNYTQTDIAKLLNISRVTLSSGFGCRTSSWSTARTSPTRPKRSSGASPRRPLPILSTSCGII